MPSSALIGKSSSCSGYSPGEIQIGELVGVLVYITNTDDQSKQCAVELIFSVDEFLQLIIILKAFCDDSLFWQGLYANSKVNLNTPLLGIWTMNSLAVRTVTDSITDLQNRVVKIIPFNFLTVDTSKFFSGGSARVYKGTYLNNEVAIKFLFCLELTPERVIEFCNEATMLNSLQHPNMVTCYGVAVMPPAISLITEYCTFGSLFDFLHTTDLISKDDERNFSALSASTKNRFQSDSYYDNPDSSNGRMSLKKADTAAAAAASSDRNSYVVSPMITFPLDEKGSGSTIIPKEVSGSPTTTIANGEKIEERRRIHEQSSLDASAFPISGGGGGSDSPGTVKVRSSSADSTALDLIVHQLSLQHSAELSASSRYINRDTIDENGHFNSNNCDEIRGSSIISRSSCNVDTGVLQSPRISIVYRNTSDRFESSASYVAQGLNDGDSSCDSNSQRSIDIASKLVEALTGNGTASGRGSVRFTLSRTLPENQGMVAQPTGNSKSWFKSAVSLLMSSEMGFGFAPVTTGSVKLKKGARKQADQEHEESGRSSHRLLSVKHTSVLLMGKLLPMNTRMQMARDCCAGLAFLHSRNFMHCDIKSLNFLDYGATLKVDQSADIWSLVMVLSEIFTGEIPYDSQYYRQMDIHAFNAAIKEGHRPKIPPRIMNITWLSKLIQRAWSYEAADRCTAKELAEAYDINFKSSINQYLRRDFDKDSTMLFFRVYILQDYNACRLPRQKATIETFSEIARLPRWPSFYASKQRLATNPNLFFHRVSSSHSLRFKATINLLRSNQQFLANIGTVGWPKEVWYRYDKILLMFRLSDQGEPIVVEENFVSLDVLEIRTRIFEAEPLENKPVLFLELQEWEGNPCSYIATLIHLSNSNVFGITKEFAKAGAKYMLIDPTTTNDLCKMACMEAKFGTDYSVFKGIDEKSIVETVTARVNILGPIPRSVFLTETAFDTECAELEENAASLFDVAGKISVDNLPNQAKRFIAPFVDDDSVVPYLKGDKRVSYSLRYLSEYIALLVAKECTSEARREILRPRKFLHLIQEDIVRHGLMDRTVLEKKFISTMKLNDNWFVKKWTFFKNAKNRNTKKAVNFKATGITSCNRVEYFDAMYLERPVLELQEHVLYVSKKHNGALYDCMYVDHAKKCVFAFQTSDKDPHKHSLEVGTVYKVMLKLQLPLHKYTMKYFYCCSDTKVLMQGCILKEVDASSEETSLAKAMKIYIAMIKFFE
eukprot:gene24382-32827_t